MVRSLGLTWIDPLAYSMPPVFTRRFSTFSDQVRSTPAITFRGSASVNASITGERVGAGNSHRQYITFGKCHVGKITRIRSVAGLADVDSISNRFERSCGSVLGETHPDCLRIVEPVFCGYISEGFDVCSAVVVIDDCRIQEVIQSHSLGAVLREPDTVSPPATVEAPRFVAVGSGRRRPDQQK